MILKLFCFDLHLFPHTNDIKKRNPDAPAFIKKNRAKTSRCMSQSARTKKETKSACLIVLKAEGEDIVDEIHLNMELEQVKQYISVLDEREKEVIINRFGLGRQREKTQREIAKELGISRSYVSRIEKRALMKNGFTRFYRQGKRKTAVITKAGCWCSDPLFQ